MIVDDPFTHEDFRDRLGKLLRLLASDHDAEAEAARRKLLQHLAHHGVTLSDLTAHLGEVHDGAATAPPDALRHAAVRAQRAESAHRAAEEMNTRLLRSLEDARRRARVASVAACVLAASALLAGGSLLAVRMWPWRTSVPTVQQMAPRVSDMVGRTTLAPATTPAPATTTPDAARQPGEWIGTVVQPAELLEEPDSAAQRRAMLDSGARVMVMQGGPNWLRVRTERGDGYILKGLVRPDR